MDGQLVKELFAIALGLGLFVVRKKFARQSVEGQNKSFGFRFGQKEIESAVIFNTVLSIGIIIAAIISLLEITTFRI